MKRPRRSTSTSTLTSTLTLTCAFALSLWFHLPANAQNVRHPLTFDDLYAIGRVSDPQLSPDGKRVLYTVTTFDVEGNSSNSDIYAVEISSSKSVKLTASPKGDMHPRWSPDGSKIAFLSSRDGAPQIWTMNPDGSEQKKVTNLSSGVGSFEWSPKGSWFLYSAETWPDCPGDDCNRARDTVEAARKSKARIFESLPIRVWNSWRTGKVTHVYLMPSGGGAPTDVTPGEFDSPPIDLSGEPDYAMSPDEKEIAFVRNTEESVVTNTNNDIWLTDLDRMNVRCITKENKAVDNQPVYSPDGRFIAYRAMSRPGFEGDKYDLMVYDRRAGKARKLTAGVDRSVQEVFWSPDSKKIFFSAEEEGTVALFEMPAAGGDVLKVLRGSFTAQYRDDTTKLKLSVLYSGFRLGPDGKTLVFLAQRSNLPNEVIATQYDGKTVSRFTQITKVNEDLLKKIEMNPAESFTFKGDGGTQVQGWLIKPPYFDEKKKYPMIFLVHGGPQGAWQDEFHYRWNYQMFAARGYVVVAINPRGSTGFGQQFTDEISGDWGGKVYGDLIKGLDYAIKTYPFIDAGKMGAAGASYGGYMMNWLLGHTPRFKAIVSHAGVFNTESEYGTTEELWFPEWEFKGTPWANPQLYYKFSPNKFAKNFHTPTLVTHGEQDFRVPYSEALQLFTYLQRNKVPSKFILFPDEGHFVTKPQNAKLWWASVLEWFDKYLK